MTERKTEVVELNIGDIKITFFDAQGNPAAPGTLLRAHNFRIEGPGIDSKRVLSVELPKLSYGSSDLLTVKVEMWPFDLNRESSK